ncbi:MAG: hypothetical protein RQ982_13545 [Gammaproteobacteria bacterium]|nr:hypothetical protein [Gammaproteobacteria bacterium]
MSPKYADAINSSITSPIRSKSCSLFHTLIALPGNHRRCYDRDAG